jgi:hypothetical protein
VIHEFWLNESCPDDWLEGRLKMLFKGKGKREVLGNWRGIMLLDAASKIVCAIISGRISGVLREEGLEAQNGFTAGRGTADGIFSLKLLLQKRKEHGLSSWVVFVDLVKAFDSVPREGLMQVLRKMGVPARLRSLIASLHSNFMVKVKAGEEDVAMHYTTGVKQGDSLAPILFNVYIQACLELLDARWGVRKAEYKWLPDEVLTGRSIHKASPPPSQHLHQSLYADDGAFVFTSREDSDSMTPIIFQTLKDFGLTMHVGRDGDRGKTEAVFFPAASAVVKVTRGESTGARTEPKAVAGKKQKRKGAHKRWQFKCQYCTRHTSAPTEICKVQRNLLSLPEKGVKAKGSVSC